MKIGNSQMLHIPKRPIFWMGTTKKQIAVGPSTCHIAGARKLLNMGSTLPVGCRLSSAALHWLLIMIVPATS